MSATQFNLDCLVAGHGPHFCGGGGPERRHERLEAGHYVFIPISGWLADRFGSHLVLVFGSAVVLLNNEG